MIEPTTLTPLGTQDPGTLEPPSAKDGRATGQRESASAGGLRSPGVDGEPAIRVDGGSEDGLPVRVGDRDEGVGVSPRTRKTSPSYRSIQRPSTRTKPCPRSPHSQRSPDWRRQLEAESRSQSCRHSHAENNRSRKPPGYARGKGCACEVHRLGRDAETRFQQSRRETGKLSRTS